MSFAEVNETCTKMLADNPLSPSAMLVTHVTYGKGKLVDMKAYSCEDYFDIFLTIEFESGETKKFSLNIVNSLGLLDISEEANTLFNSVLDAGLDAWAEVAAETKARKLSAAKQLIAEKKQARLEEERARKAEEKKHEATKRSAVRV